MSHLKVIESLLERDKIVCSCCPINKIERKPRGHDIQNAKEKRLITTNQISIQIH